MAVHQLGGIAHRVGGDGALALDVELTAGLRGEHHVEVQLGEEFKPEGQVFIHIQREGNADLSPAAVALTHAVHGAQLLILVLHEVGHVLLLAAQRAWNSGCRR